MFRDELFGFTNWTDVKEELDYELDRDITGNPNAGPDTPTATDTPTETPDGTATPVPRDALPTLQIAAHTPAFENYRQATLESDIEQQQGKFALSDVLTDFVLNGEHEDVYGVLVGGSPTDPTLIKASYDEKDFFDAVRDLQADRSYSLAELASEYRASGTTPTI